jgi:hypothetical protein
MPTTTAHSRAVVLNLRVLTIRELNLPMIGSWCRGSSRVTEFDIQLMDAGLRISALRYSPQRHATSRADTASKHQSAPPSATRQCLCLNFSSGLFATYFNPQAV